MKKKNKGKKSLTAVGAVVAAGLTPGIVTGAPASQPPIPDVEFTAADAVSIGGDVFDFDELFAMQQVVTEQQHPKTVYGPPPPIAKDDDVRQAAIRAKMREDSIRRAMEARELVYGPPSMLRMSIAEELRQIAADSKDRAIGYIQEDITYWITRKFNITDATIGPDTDLTKDLKLDFEQLQILRDEIEENYDVQISDDMLRRLNTLDRLTKFIVEVVKPIEE